MSESNNFYRLIQLLAKGGTMVLRQLLSKYTAPLDVPDYLYRNQGAVLKLKFYENQRKLVVGGDIDKMDITLLCKLILDLFTTSLTDREKDGISAIKDERNSMLHSELLESAKLDTKTFERRWQDISSILLDLADEIQNPEFIGNVADFIDETKRSNPGFSEILHTLKEWCQSSTELQEKVDSLAKSVEELKVSQAESSKTIQMTKCDGLKDKFRGLYDFFNAQDIQLTQKMEEARKHLSESYSVFLFGRAGEGKTTAAFRLAKSLVDNKIVDLERCALIYEPEDLKHIQSRDVHLLLIDDLFGKHNAEASKLTLWQNFFLTLQALVSRSKVRLIFATRMHIYLEFKRELNGYDVFSRTVELNSAEMTLEEKRYILQTQLKANDREMDDADVEECICQTETNAGFPLCAQQFASDLSLFSKKAGYFAKPFKYCLEQNLQNVDDQGVIALLYVFYKGNRLHLSEIDLAKMDQSSQDVLQHIAKLRGIENSIAAVVKVTKQKLINFKGSFLKYIGKTFSFLHDTMYETVAKLHAEDHPSEVIEHCTIDYLCQCMRLEKIGNADVIIIERDNFKTLAKRCVIEVVQHENGKRLSKQCMFENRSFVIELVSVVAANEETFKKFFYKGLSFMYPDGIHAFLYHIIENSQANCLFFQEVQKHLRCHHSLESDEICWKCKVKSEALSAVCSINSNDMYKEFRADNIELGEYCLYKAVEKMDADPEFVKMVIKDLKESGKYVVDNQYLQYSLGLTLKQKDKQLLFNILKESGIHLTTKILYFAVEHSTPELLNTFLQELVRSKRWKPDDMYTSRAIVAAHATGKTECLGILTDAGAKLTAWSVCWSIIDYGFEETAHFIKTLKGNDSFDPDSYEIAWAMANAMKNEDKRIYQLLKEEGVVPTCALVYTLTDIGHDTDDIVRVIEECKLAGRWNPEESAISLAYMSSRRRADQKLTDVLVKHGAGITPYCLSEHETNTIELDQVVKTLKDTGRFDPSDARFASALVRSIEYKDKTIYNKLVSEGLYLTLPCLSDAVVSTIDTLQFVITDLKKENRWKAEDDEALHALHRAFLREDKAAYEMLLAEGLSWKTGNLYVAVVYETLHDLKFIIREMKRRGLLDADDDYVLHALKIAFLLEDKAKYEMLLAEGLSWKTRNLYVAVECETLHDLKHIIREMKRRGLLDADDDYVLHALNVAFLLEDKAKYEMLLAEGLSWKTRNLYVAAEWQTSHDLELIIREMKRRGC